MRTNINIDDKPMADVLHATGAKPNGITVRKSTGTLIATRRIDDDPARLHADKALLRSTTHTGLREASSQA